MKKLVALFIVAGMVGFIACGPSQKDKEAKAKKTQDSLDSIAKDQHMKDSLAQIRITDSLKKQHEEDSLAALKNKPKGTKPKTGGTQTPKPPTTPKGKG